MTDTTNQRRRHLPYVGRIVTIRWNSGNDTHPDEQINRGMVINVGRTTLWIDAFEQGVKPRQDVFIKYADITLIQEETSAV